MISTNEYFDGKVKSLAFNNSQGQVTSGVMDIGEYVFGTTQHEIMKVISGELSVKLPQQDNFVSFGAGSEFEVPANAEFTVIVKEQTAYLCFYS